VSGTVLVGFYDNGGLICDPINFPPIAKAHANPSIGVIDFAMAFDGSGSFDLDRDVPLSYHWNFDDGESSEAESPVHTFKGFGIFKVLLTVKDARGASSEVRLDIEVFDQPPTPSAHGDLVISEIMRAPSANGPAVGEYVEVFNPTATPFMLFGCLISDTASVSHEIQGDVVVPPGAFATLAVSEAAFAHPDYVYRPDPPSLGKTDGVIITCSGTIIDQVVYGVGDENSFPDTSGTSMNLDPDALDATLNDNGLNWCETPRRPEYWLTNVPPDGIFGDYGTPGAHNVVCDSD
jgi:PKD repeat protein